MKALKNVSTDNLWLFLESKIKSYGDLSGSYLELRIIQQLARRMNTSPGHKAAKEQALSASDAEYTSNLIESRKA